MQCRFRRTSGKLKFHLAITSVTENAEVWSDRMITAPDRLDDLEEEIAAQISTIVAPQILYTEARRILSKPEAEWTAWEKMMRVIGLSRTGRRSDFHEDERLAKDACARAPDWGLPHSMLGFLRFQMAMTGFSNADSHIAFAPALEAATVALDIDRSDWLAHALTAVGALWTDRNHERALNHVNRAIDLNPSAAMNYHFGGCINGFSGDLDLALRLQERLFRIDPTYPYRAVIEADLGLWHLLGGDMQAAEDRLDRALSWNPTYGRALQRRTVFHGLTGQRAAAQDDIARLVELGLPVDGASILDTYPFLNSDHLKTFRNGLQNAGVNV